ncbi:MAG: hypothetical protein WCD80_02525 [Desulfobaccales bacterium]
MLLMVAGVLAWSAVVQAAPISFYYSNYYAYTSAENTDAGGYDKDVVTNSSPPISASAQEGNATAYASAGVTKFLFAEASESGENWLAQSWVHADLRFTASTDQVHLKFNYYLEAYSVGDAAAYAQLHLYLGGSSWQPDDIIANASSSGDMSDSASISGNVDEVVAVTPGQDYQLWLEIWWVYAQGYTGTAAYGQAWIDNFSLDDGSTTPATHSPAPATWLLLSSGLAALLGWRRWR